MKTSTLTFLALLLIATTAAAQESAATPPAQPDYSRDSLMRVLAVDERPERKSSVQFHIGAIDFTALGMRWRFFYVPMLPLAGSRPVVSQVMPDAFSLTNTEIARPPRTWRDRRAMSDEMRRIERLERERATVVLKP